MQVSEAQFEVRSTYLGGFVGQLISGFLWLLSCSLTTWISYRAGITVFVIGGFFIFPINQAVLRLMGRTASLSTENPFRELAIQVAFLVPLLLPLVGARWWAKYSLPISGSTEAQAIAYYCQD